MRGKLIIIRNSSAENIYDFILLFCYEKKKTIYYLLQNMHVTFDLKDTISDTMIIIKKKL